MLRDAVAIFLRCLPIVIVALIVLGAGCLLVPIAIGRCAMSEECLPSSLFAYFLFWLDSIRQNGDRIASWIVLTLTLPAIYALASRRYGLSARIGAGRWHTRSLMMRCLIYLIILGVPAYIGDLIYLHFVRLYPEHYDALLWLRRFILVGTFAYLDARLALYPPSTIGVTEPDSLARCWHRTSAVWRPLFFVFFASEGVFVLANVAVWHFARQMPDLWWLAARIAGLSGLPEEYLLSSLPRAAGFVVGSVGSSCFFAAVSLALYRQAKAIDIRVHVFD